MKDDELGKVYPGGEVVFREGAVGEAMYVIQSGKVKITKTIDGDEVTIAILESGEIFGEMALFDRLPRSATAVALGDTRILAVDRKKLFANINRDPTLVFKILESMSGRIRSLDGELTKLKRGHADVLHFAIDVEETCRRVLGEARTLIEADNGSVMLLGDDGSLAVRAAFGTEAGQKMRFSAGEGVAGDVLKTGREELLNDVLRDPRFIPGELPVASLLCVPLRHRDSLFGVINMSTRAGGRFRLDDLKVLHSLAVYASLAVQNAISLFQMKDTAADVLRHATMLHM